jgi:hypothetical protein
MGHTILAHALFACNQYNFNLDNFFSITGDAHQIKNLNTTILTVKHLIEYPDNDAQCILEVQCREWWEVFRLKMSYSKWRKTVPILSNASDFYSFQIDADKKQQKLWQDFYKAYQDPSWPDCDCIDDVVNLPINIQQEIKRVYLPPVLEAPTTNDKFVEWLSECYYDQFCNPPVSNFKNTNILMLGNYIQGNYLELIEVCSRVLGWTWDTDRGIKFHAYVLQANAPYLDWLKKIKHATHLLINNSANQIVDQFELWEQAIILAMACRHVQISVNQLLWNTVGCTTAKNNVYLNIFTRTIHHGKTIRHFKIPQGNYQKH